MTIVQMVPDGKVHEFYFIPETGHWQHSDVTQSADGPNLNAGLSVSEFAN